MKKLESELLPSEPLASYLGCRYLPGAFDDFDLVFRQTLHGRCRDVLDGHDTVGQAVDNIPHFFPKAFVLGGGWRLSKLIPSLKLHFLETIFCRFHCLRSKIGNSHVIA